MHEPILGTPPVRAAVRQEDGGAAHAEETVGKEHGSLFPLVVVGSDDLGADNDRVRVRVHLEKITSQVDRDKPRAAPHSRKIKTLYITPQLVFVDHHGRQRRRRRKQAAVNNKNIDVPRFQPRLLKQTFHSREDNDLRLASGGLHRRRRRNVMNSGRQTSLLAETRPLKNPHLKLDALRVVTQIQPGMLHEGRERNPASHRRLVTLVIHKENASRLGQEVNSGDKDDEERRAQDLNNIKVKRSPQVNNLLGT
ncbi:hypothetical protein GQ457_10G025290 [Hibiscus cannabinus]